MVETFKNKNNDSITIKKKISLSDMKQENLSSKSSITSMSLSNDATSKNNHKKTLHEVTTKDFNRTPKGLMFAKDIKDIFCIVLICLDMKKKLVDKTNVKKKKKRSFISKLASSSVWEFNNEAYYCFYLDECIEEMKNLAVNVNMETTTVSILYSIKPEMSLQLIKIFMNAKLLHNPTDRTNTDLNNKSILQPTPKGVSILTKYIKDMGIKKQIPDIVFSNLNSTYLFNFERSSVTDRIIYSDYFIKLIFTKMFSDAPTIWSPDTKSNKIACLKTLLGGNDDINEFDFTGQQTQNIMDIINQQHSQAQNPFADTNIIFPDELQDAALLNDEDRVSPLHHKFFTNPESDSHIQYYSHLSGIRMFYNKEFIEIIQTEKKNIKTKKQVITYSFSTKAIVQWLMDCTDLIYFKEAVIMASLFYKCGLITPICLSPSVARKDNFTISKKNLYTFTKKGCDWLDWNENYLQSLYTDWSEEREKRLSQLEKSVVSTGSNEELASNEDLKNKEVYVVSLESILNDPGKRFLFKSHLDKELCSENFSAYTDIKKFLKKMDNVENFVDVKEKTKRLSNKDAKSITLYNSLKSRLMKECNDCLSMAYQIFATYIADRSSKLINIDYNLRNLISNLILNSSSSLTAKNPLSPFSEALGIKENTITQEKSNIKSLVIDEAVDPNFKIHTSEWPTKINSMDRKSKPMGLNILGDSQKQIINKDSDYFFSNQLFKDNIILDSPTEGLVTHSLYILSKLKPLFEDVNRKLYKIMETDSLPKFLNNNKDILDDVKQ
ncbi:uncharacterized protein HGUI_03584 [Hanseniaspora guilliermondii]|uniref:Protein SST2 n=1 Tax=Hanseniaspora guilliermondii TaxID=56406 RepID=A0A1L0D2J5_9ASCO|nr:uncharacterized protein HGUI_03584 [Hanseniaspora guilliermondii]